MISELAITTTGGRAASVAWRTVLEPVLPQRKGRTALLRAIADQHGVPYKTVERKFYDLQRSGPAALVDKRSCGPVAWSTSKPVGLSDHDKGLLKTYVERNQRKAAPAIKALRRDWAAGIISTPTEIDLATGYPRGWSEANLMRHPQRAPRQSALRPGQGAAHVRPQGQARARHGPSRRRERALLMIATMKWKCLVCREIFEGPKDHSPGSCPHCSSTEIFDINVERAERPPGTYVIFPIRAVIHGKN